RALGGHHRVVLDADGPVVVALLEHRRLEVAESMVAVDHHRGLPEHASCADLDRPAALDEHVVREDALRTDHDAALGLDLTAKAPAELDAVPGDEGAAEGHVQAEPWPEVDVLPEADVSVGIADQHPTLAER